MRRLLSTIIGYAIGIAEAIALAIGKRPSDDDRERAIAARAIRDAAAKLERPSCELCLGFPATYTCSRCAGTGLEPADSGRARQQAIDVRALEEMADEIACGGALHPRG